MERSEGEKKEHDIEGLNREMYSIPMHDVARELNDVWSSHIMTTSNMIYCYVSYVKMRSIYKCLRHVMLSYGAYYYYSLPFHSLFIFILRHSPLLNPSILPPPPFIFVFISPHLSSPLLSSLSSNLTLYFPFSSSSSFLFLFLFHILYSSTLPFN